MATTSPSAGLVPVTPVFSTAERLALAGFLAGYSGLTRQAYARRVQAREPQRGLDRALPPGPSRSLGLPSRSPVAETLSTVSRCRHGPAHSGRTCRRAWPEDASGHEA